MSGTVGEHRKGLYGNQLFERMLLVFTEQAAYPPNHYVRYVPQKQIHLFTLCQTVQLLVLGKRQKSCSEIPYNQDHSINWMAVCVALSFER